MQTLYLQEFNKKIKYIVGDYDLEVLTLPRLLINDVNVAQSHTTKVLIPAPGLVNVFMTAKGIVSIFVEENNELTLVCNISQNTNRETIVLQPGNYRVVHRGVNAKKALYTLEKSFKITSGSSTQVKF